MSDIKLKPCPFCGSDVVFDRVDGLYLVICESCGTMTTFGEKIYTALEKTCGREKTIEKWNTRVPIESQMFPESVRESIMRRFTKLE